MNVIGGKRLVGTGYLRCTKCGVRFKPGETHPPFKFLEFVSGFPVNVDCPNVGKISTTNISSDDWNEYLKEWI
jgi:hypothetical protein